MNDSHPMPSTMNEAQYLYDRLEDQIAWYSNKSASCRRRYATLRIVEVVAAALIPFLSGITRDYKPLIWVVGGLGAVIAICSAISGLFKFHENWIQYRATTEALMHEKFFFLTRSGEYKDEDRLHILVQRVEALISRENSAWAQTIKGQSPKSDSPSGPAPPVQTIPK